jgi:hypothetical protein
MRKFLLALAIAALPVSAHAFGAPGHKLIAKLAYERLTPQAKADVNSLLALAPQQGTPMCSASTLDGAAVWADCVRNAGLPQFHDLTHHEKIPSCTSMRAKPPCPDGKCLSAQTDDALQTLRNSSGATVARLQALEVVIHFVGDAHQPLHTTNAYGSTGRNIAVIYPGSRSGRTLHKIWDTELVTAATTTGGGVTAIRNLESQNASRWATGSPEDWVQESHQVAMKSALAPLGLNGCGHFRVGVQTITPGYIASNATVEQQQIAKAAVRLAYVLNSVLR